MSTPASAPNLPEGSVVLWPPQGAGDFADLAWVIGEALGNGPGVCGLDVHQSRDPEGLFAYVRTTGSEYVRSVAAAFGWDVYEPDAGYAHTSGVLAGVLLSVTWMRPDPSRSEESEQCVP